MSEKLLDILKPKGHCIPEELLIRYAQGKLSADEARRVEEHISECEFCSDALDGIMQNGNVQHFRSELSSIKKIVHKKVRRGEASETFPIMRILGIAATLLVIAISAWYVQYLINNNSERIFTHEFAPYPVPQLGDSNKPAQLQNGDIIQSEQSPDSSSKINSQKNLRLPREEKKEPPKQTEVARSHNETKVIEEPTQSVAENNADVVPQEDQSVQKIIADSVSAPSASYSYSAPSQSMTSSQSLTLNETSIASGQEKDIERKAKDEENHKIMVDNLNTAISYYQSNQYAEAIAAFRLVLDQEPNNPAANFYSGVSSLALKNPDEALKYFKKTDYKTGQYYEATLWYEALSYLSKNDKKQAKKLFEKVVEFNGEYKVKAEETLKQL